MSSSRSQVVLDHVPPRWRDHFRVGPTHEPWCFDMVWVRFIGKPTRKGRVPGSATLISPDLVDLVADGDAPCTSFLKQALRSLVLQARPDMITGYYHVRLKRRLLRHRQYSRRPRRVTRQQKLALRQQRRKAAEARRTG